ncbi:hypothetical protein TrVFT333_005953 [Trichoderma virens FT-333]|nr:hypothetical protein TrVFT333_005953 [Trichoderma virens FT-333]
MPKVDRRAKLAELKALRQAGKKAFESYQVEDADDLYDEVDEAGYKKIVRDRLNQDDFVVDDNGEGYADDGREDWDRVRRYESDSEGENELPVRGRPSKAAKKSREEELAKRDANDRSISEYFTKGAGKAQPKPKVTKTKADDDFLADLLGEVDANIPAPAPKASKVERSGGERRRARDLSPAPEPSYKKQKRVDIRLPSPEPAPPSFDDDDDLAPLIDDEPMGTADVPMSDPAPSSPAAKVAQRKALIKQEPQSDDDDDMMEVAHAGAVKVASRVRDGEETGDEVDMTNVYTEVDEIMTKMNVGMYKIKKCERKYAFELPDIPKEAEYMKLLYPYTKPAINMEAKGETFSHVFGTNTALFEQFVLWKNIMGPCWLKIQDADFGAIKNASHCKLEVLAEHPNMVSTISDSDNMDMPPLTLMSIALRTTFNAKENKQEILAISARIYDKVLLSDTTPAEKLPCRTFTVIRPHGQAFPMGFDTLVKKRDRGLILKKQESDLLSFFLAQVDVADPDVILGHQLEGVDYSVLLNRLFEKKVHQWSRLGRLRRTQWPSSIGKTGGNVFAERQVMAGRLLCDLANDAGKSAMFKCQTWSLTEMCSLYLTGDNRRRDVDNEVALNTWAKESQGLMDYVTHMEADTHYIAALAVSVQLLPLTKVLTNLAGNSWARTLTGTRAERNEYILLHEFHRNKYICPDKQTFKGRQKAEEENAEEEGGDGKKKDKYKGGLVFEPEKGLYDKFVLVMDFNSLYPSIIQEFNICFTTVDRTASAENEDAVPEVPVNQDQGILPRLIATLVSRRRQVKNLMKDKKATPEELATWDIKQLALKLTANSMYGCLGYTRSRFYARPLAILTTHKGREILRSTKDLAESKSLQVIYGDTDSVMINANVDNVADAFKVGNEFKKAVNEQYRLLEIDIDNVFRRILLQAKKKYAAINLIEKDGKFIEKMEVKGLDMRRREYCALSKEVSKHLLDDILSGDDIEVSVARIHEYLRDIATKMRDFAIPVPKYTIYTQLGKGPKEYPNADSMPQVQVALRDLARGKTIRKGDVISYIVTGTSQSSEPAPKRAYAPPDLKADPSLQPDVDWYIAKQIFPPVERLCANIAGTSTSQLAEQLGLDVRRYTSTQTQQSGSSDDLEIHPLESQIPDEVRFVDCKRLALRCRKCKATSAFEGLTGSPDRVTASGVICPGCGAVIPTLSVVAQVEHAVRLQTSRYYEGWLVCDDPQCGNRTRQMSVYGICCMGPKGLARDCAGNMHYEYTEKAIYNQLVYFASLWDVDKAKAKALDANNDLTGQEREKIRALVEHNRVRFTTVKAVVDKYLDKCGRQWVAMDTLFAKLGFSKMLGAVSTAPAAAS